MVAAVELFNDPAGIIWPAAIAPFEAVVTPVNVRDASLLEAAEKLYKDLQAAGIDVLLDDRDERAGVKFNDADLVGMPYRLTVGKKIKDGKVELFTRAIRQSEDVALEDVIEALRTRLADNA